MYKILFCDYLFQTGNICVDNVFLDILCKNNDVYALTSHDRVPKENKVTIIEKSFYKYKKGKIRNFFRIIRIMINSARYARIIKPDMIFISVYETRLFGIARSIISKKIPIAILENINVDMLENKLYLWCYKKYSNKVYHFVYENYIGSYLINKIGVKREKVFTISHPTYPDISIENNEIYKKYNLIAISGSNDDNWIQQIIDFEKETSFFVNNKISFLVKSKTNCFSDDFLVVVNNHLSNAEYNYYYHNCDFVVAPFPLSYKYRMSGCLIDSFSNNKRVIATKFMLALEYERKFDGIIKCFDNIEELLNIVLSDWKTNSDAFIDFKKEHSANKIESQFDYALNTIINTTGRK